jgi:hypothetical protein
MRFDDQRVSFAGSRLPRAEQRGESGLVSGKIGEDRVRLA